MLLFGLFQLVLLPFAQVGAVLHHGVDHGVEYEFDQFDGCAVFPHEEPIEGALQLFRYGVQATGTGPIGVHTHMVLFMVMQQPLPVKSGHALPRQPYGCVPQNGVAPAKPIGPQKLLLN